MAWYLRLFEFFKRKRAGLHGKDLVKSSTSHITVAELKSAELQVAIYEQRRYLSNLILALKNGNRLSSKVCSFSIRKLNPFISHNVVRVGGRLGKASISADARHPIILPSNSYFTKLVIRWYSSFGWTFWIQPYFLCTESTILDRKGRLRHSKRAQGMCNLSMPKRSSLDSINGRSTGMSLRYESRTFLPYRSRLFWSVLSETRKKPSQAIWLYFHMYDNASCTS